MSFKVGNRVMVHYIDKVPDTINKGQHKFELKSQYGIIEKDFLLVSGNQSLFCILFEDGSRANVWNDQMELI